MSLSYHILLIDDSSEDRTHIKAALLKGSSARFKFSEASTINAGLSFFETNERGTYNCVILDFDLPDGDATDFMKRMPRLANVIDIPILVLTGSGADRNKLVLHSGAHEYLGKGWLTPASVNRAVENAIDRHFLATQLARSHARLSESEEFAQSIINSSPDCVELLDLEWHIHHINPLGLSLKEIDKFESMDGKNWLDAWPEQQRSLAIEATREARAGKIGRFQGRCPTFKGSPKFWDVIISSVRNSEGQIEKFLAVSRDITQIKQNEELIRESEQRFRSIADISPIIIWVSDTIGQCSYLNAAWEEMTGQQEAEGLGDGWMNYVHIDDQAATAQLISQAVESRLQFNARFRLRRKDQSFTWVLLNAAPREAGDNFLGLVGSVIDLTDQTQLEQMVNERTARLKETIGELESVSYSISHDLRQPLRSMHQMSQIILEDYGHCLDDTGITYLNRLITASSRLDRLIQDVLTLSRVSRFGEHLKSVDLNRIVQDVVTQYPTFNFETLDIEVSKPLLHVIAHEALLTQVVSNLLGNAVKFKSEDRPLQIRIWSEKKANYVRLWIEDNGIGIAEQNLERIWKVFEQIDPTVNSQGTGIGLSIVKKAVERMHGKAGLESSFQSGSRFWVDLPAAS